jgi:hypothetical protein
MRRKICRAVVGRIARGGAELRRTARARSIFLPRKALGTLALRRAWDEMRQSCFPRTNKLTQDVAQEQPNRLSGRCTDQKIS